MHFAKRPDGTIPNQHDVDSALHEILGVQECHTLHSLRKVRQTWTVALNATGLPAAKITFLWDHMLDAVRPTWLADEMAPDFATLDWTTATNAHFTEYYELAEMLYFVWAALKTNVPRAQPPIPTRPAPNLQAPHNVRRMCVRADAVALPCRNVRQVGHERPVRDAETSQA
tara:strand:- start:1429 stop:1941 length:513 start_codon:yes stop_codon:yes gene_type:complete